MKSTGMVRDIDSVGRVVIPKEIRGNLKIKEKDPLEIYVEEDMIILRKYTPACIFCGSAEDMVTYMDKKICKTCLAKFKQL